MPMLHLAGGSWATIDTGIVSNPQGKAEATPQEPDSAVRGF